MAFHTAETMVVAGVVGGIKYGANAGILEDGDLNSDVATAKAAVKVDNDRKHISQRYLGTAVDASLELANEYEAGFVGGSDLTPITGNGLLNTEGYLLTT